jgi:hypothetical protein
MGVNGGRCWECVTEPTKSVEAERRPVSGRPWRTTSAVRLCGEETPKGRDTLHGAVAAELENELFTAQPIFGGRH